MTRVNLTAAFPANSVWPSAGVRDYLQRQAVHSLADATELRNSDMEMVSAVLLRSTGGVYRLNLASSAADDGDTVIHDAISRRYERLNGGVSLAWDASGTLAGRAAHDAEAQGFSYAVTDGAALQIYVKESATSADWSAAFSWTGPQGDTGAAGIDALTSELGAGGFVFKDSADEVLMTVEPEEIIHPHVAAIEASALDGQRVARKALDWADARKSDAARLLGQINHFIGWGQSNGNHMGARRDVRAMVETMTLMPNGGPSWRGLNLATDVLPAVGFTSLRPIWQGGYAAMFRMVHQLLRDEDGIDLTGLNMQMLVTSAAKNGASMADLAGADFPRFDVDLDEGHAEATALSKTWHPAGCLMVHGETEQSVLYGGPMTMAAYLAALSAMQAQTQAAAQAEAGMTLALPMLVSQLGSHIHQSVTTPSWTVQPPNIALAQLAADDLANIACVGPTYHLPYEDGQHFTGYNDSDLNGVWPHGYEWLGAYFGLAIKRWYFDRVKPQPLKPIHVAIMGNSLVVTFNVEPGRKLVIDTSTVPAQTVNSKYGFTVDNGSGAAIVVNSAELLGRDKVVLKLAATPTGAAKVRYGWVNDTAYVATPVAGNCGAGNLRDDDPLVFSPGFSGYAMHKWCCIFEKGVS